jgi:hypothetical protein
MSLQVKTDIQEAADELEKEGNLTIQTAQKLFEDFGGDFVPNGITTEYAQEIMNQVLQQPLVTV